jgi:HAD superfamily hydrolase (TIGR01509 family)
VKGLFLDFDGTLADSLPALRDAYTAFLDGFGRPASEAEFAALNGPPLAVIVRELKQTHGLEPDEAALLASYRARLAEAAPLVRPVRGAAAVLARAAERGWAVAVVTSGSRTPTEAFLQRFGLQVAVVIGGEDAPPGKPDPAPYRLALQRTGCAADASLAVEDSFGGASAAVGAGLPTWVVGEAEAPAGVRGRLPSLEALLNLL